MRALRGRLERYAASTLPILIRGETGSGKEVVARTVHDNSDRLSHPFIAVNCAAIPENLVESELFGTALGAFTGARKRRGWFELAEQGTLFLDEIGDLPLTAQASLLRVLETGRIWRVGGDVERRVHARLLFATHRPLETMVSRGTFRADLYHRISPLVLTVPPLRHRSGDLRALVEAFLEGRSRDLSPAAWSVLESYHWPGNVRELRNVLLRAAVLASPEPIDTRHLVFEADATHADVPRSVRRLSEVLAEHVNRSLRIYGGNVRATARALDVSPTTVYRYMALQDQSDASH